MAALLKAIAGAFSVAQEAAILIAHDDETLVSMSVSKTGPQKWRAEFSNAPRMLATSRRITTGMPASLFLALQGLLWLWSGAHVLIVVQDDVTTYDFNVAGETLMDG
jgi:hypothetical protein